ncbi:hypothetical protein IL306_008139 [Fusarium sp. DS 682]|nr:hypothetical protein IL306_008139 [Fusarium sp. DS 682]
MASRLIAAWQPTVDSLWDRYLRYNASLGEADQAMERDNITLILTLTGQGQIEEAIIECGRMWQRESERRAPSLKFAHGGCDNHPVIWILSRIYGSVKYPDLWEACGNYCINPAFLIVQGMARDLPTDSHALLKAFVTVTVYWLSVKNILMITEAMKFGTRLLSQIETIPNFDSHVAVSLRNSLAVAFLRSQTDGLGKPGIDSDPGWNITWAQREAIIRAFLNSRNEGLSDLDGDMLRLFYSFIDVGLPHQLDDSKVVDEMMQLYRDREAVYNERHDTSMSFIIPLLRELVQLMRKVPGSLAPQEEHGFIYDLVDFCLANGKYDQAQVLVQEFMSVPSRIIPTDSSTNREEFSRWRAPTRSVQALLAQDGTPGRHYYWEDSRLYTTSIGKIEMSPAYPRDLFPKAPIKVTATPEAGLQLEISNECLHDWSGRSDSQGLRDITQQRLRGSKLDGFEIPAEGWQRREPAIYLPARNMFLSERSILRIQGKYATRPGHGDIEDAVYCQRRIRDRGQQWGKTDNQIGSASDSLWPFREIKILQMWNDIQGILRYAERKSLGQSAMLRSDYLSAESDFA